MSTYLDNFVWALSSSIYAPLVPVTTARKIIETYPCTKYCGLEKTADGIKGTHDGTVIGATISVGLAIGVAYALGIPAEMVVGAGLVTTIADYSSSSTSSKSSGSSGKFSKSM